ncbi:MAG: aminotransferase class V-fold PLP-dependent enzyme [Acidimicrobiia bacterium]|nr:aminotransferase class V-fold PLP-dependent enzyme [Acidimicrobiia bacterium]
MAVVATYLDHAATTPVRPGAIEVLLPFLTERYGNPSGAHRAARDARRALDDARDVMADALGAQPGDVVFTAGGTEADNLAIFGTLAAAGGERGAVVCSAVEHHAVLHAVEEVGGRVAPVDRQGRVDLDALADLLDEEVRLVSVMLVNNEVGTVQPLEAVAEVVRRRAPRALLHTDAVQALTWLDVASAAAGADLVSVSAHKFGGPKGTGALVVRPGVELRARIVGGGQERDRRSGTQNVAGIVAMAAAAEETVRTRAETVARVGALRSRLVGGLRAALPGLCETVDRAAAEVSPGIAHVCVPGAESEALLFLLEEAGVYAAAGSSCSSGATQLSHVLVAMGVPEELGRGALRLSLGYASTEADVDAALAALPVAVARLQRAA